MVMVVLVELIVEIFYRGHAVSFLAFNYFNVKIGIEVYEVARDKHWYNLQTRDIARFAFYLSCRMTIQIYYFAVYHRGWSMNTEIAYGVCSVGEIIILLTLMTQSDPEDRGTYHVLSSHV